MLTMFQKVVYSIFSVTFSYLQAESYVVDVGLINKVDMICLSPVGYGVQLNTISHRRQTYHINLVDQTHIQRTRPRKKTVFFKTSLRVLT